MSDFSGNEGSQVRGVWAGRAYRVFTAVFAVSFVAFVLGVASGGVSEVCIKAAIPAFVASGLAIAAFNLAVVRRSRASYEPKASLNFEFGADGAPAEARLELWNRSGQTLKIVGAGFVERARARTAAVLERDFDAAFSPDGIGEVNPFPVCMPPGGTFCLRYPFANSAKSRSLIALYYDLDGASLPGGAMYDACGVSAYGGTVALRPRAGERRVFFFDRRLVRLSKKPGLPANFKVSILCAAAFAAAILLFVMLAGSGAS